MLLAVKLNLSITAGLQRIKIFIIKSSSIRACCFLRHAVFAIVYPYSLVYIGVWNKKKERTKLDSRFFLLSASSIKKVDALKPHYYDKKKFPVLQDNSYKKNICPAF